MYSLQKGCPHFSMRQRRAEQLNTPPLGGSRLLLKTEEYFCVTFFIFLQGSFQLNRLR